MYKRTPYIQFIVNFKNPSSERGHPLPKLMQSSWLRESENRGGFLLPKSRPPLPKRSNSTTRGAANATKRAADGANFITAPPETTVLQPLENV